MDYKEKYYKLIESVKVLQETNPSDEGIQNWVYDNVPELRESEEWIRNELISLVRLDGWHPMEWTQEKKNKMIDWLEKQGNNTPTIIWHNIDEKPEEMKELFCEWESDDATWHDVAFYDEESHTFRHAKMPINVSKWIYVDELLEKLGEQKPANKVEPKFKIGDKIKLTKEPKYPAREIIAIKNDAYYFDKVVYLPFSRQDEWELVEQKPAIWKQENREELTEFENAMMHIGGSFFGENAGLDPNDTDTIKEQAELLLELAPKTEWSEEDERAFHHVLSVLEEYGGEHPSKSKFVCNWLKSIKVRMGGDKV